MFEKFLELLEQVDALTYEGGLLSLEQVQLLTKYLEQDSIKNAVTEYRIAKEYNDKMFPRMVSIQNAINRAGRGESIKPLESLLLLYPDEIFISLHECCGYGRSILGMNQISKGLLQKIIWFKEEYRAEIREFILCHNISIQRQDKTYQANFLLRSKLGALLYYNILHHFKDDFELLNLLFAPCGEGNTILHHTSRWNVSGWDVREMHCMILTVAAGHRQLLTNLFSANGDGDTPMHRLNFHDIKKFQAIISAVGQDTTLLLILFAPNKQGETPLHIAMGTSPDLQKTLPKILQAIHGIIDKLKTLRDNHGRTFLEVNHQLHQDIVNQYLSSTALPPTTTTANQGVDVVIPDSLKQVVLGALEIDVVGGFAAGRKC